MTRPKTALTDKHFGETSGSSRWSGKNCEESRVNLVLNGLSAGYKTLTHRWSEPTESCVGMSKTSCTSLKIEATPICSLYVSYNLSRDIQLCTLLNKVEPHFTYNLLLHY